MNSKQFSKDGTTSHREQHGRSNLLQKKSIEAKEVAYPKDVDFSENLKFRVQQN
jgi:hypothetical protein